MLISQVSGPSSGTTYQGVVANAAEYYDIPRLRRTAFLRRIESLPKFHTPT
jgi:hypothetical protein